MSDNNQNILNFSTQVVHAGDEAQSVQSSVVPIYASSTFLGDDAAALDAVLGGAPGYVYSRMANPTTAALEKAIAAIEGACDCVAFGSGMAALHGALLACELKPGDTALIARDIYGSSHALVENLLAPLGIAGRAVDMTDLEAVRRELRSGARVLLFEPVSNPLNKVADVAALCALAREAGALTVVDATFTPPPLLRALDLGADFAMHSATKYIGGHGDATGGVVSVRDEKFMAPLRQVLRLGGAILSPFESFLMLRGLKTLALRVREQCRNALQIAQWLETQPRIAQVFYPGLAAHPQHAVAARLLQPFQGENLFGAMLSFEIAGAGREEAFRFLDALQLIKVATTLGDAASEMSYPLISSHRGWSEAKLQAAGITPGIVRLSCGIEDARDIIADLEQALSKGQS